MRVIRSELVADFARLSVTEVTGSSIRAADWDHFAQRCRASMRSAYGHSKAWSLKHRFGSRLRLFELHLHDDGVRRKVGQCAIGQSKQERIFLDRLQLLPDNSPMWATAMAAVLRAAGPGAYTYGWNLNLEQSRADDLHGIRGVTVRAVRPITVEAVDFSRWGSWEEYWRATSNNIRRNAKRAENEIPDLALSSCHGLRSIAQVPAVVRLRAATHSRKGLTFKRLHAAVSTASTILSSPKNAFSVLATGGGEELAAFTGFRFGADTYYLGGGSTSTNAGASWYLMMSMLREAYEHCPDGKFIMGYVDHAIHTEAAGGGLLRSRRSCRVTDYETSVVRYSWSPPGN